MKILRNRTVGLASLLVGALAACSSDDHSRDTAGSSTGGAPSNGGVSAAQTGGAAHADGGARATGGASTLGAGGARTGGAGGSTAAGGHQDAADARAPVEAGTADASRPVVAACDGLREVDAFEDITPPHASLSDNGIVDILVDPLHAGTIYVGTDKSGLFKSANCGADWVKINTGRSAAALDSGTLWSMAIDPVDPNVIYAGSLYGSDLSLFKSTNGGVDFDPAYAPKSEIPMTVEYNFFQDLSLDPRDPKHIVLSFHANCMGMYAPSCMAESKDAGATWRLFKSPKDGWSEGAAPHVLGPTTWLLGTAQDGIYYTKDSGANWERVGPGMNGHIYHSAASDSFYATSDYGLLHSPDAHVWTEISGAPKGNDIMGDGKRLFAGQRNVNDQKQPYYTSAEGDGTTWKPFPSPKMEHGAVHFGYDPAHHLLYSVNAASGLWRMVTQ